MRTGARQHGQIMLIILGSLFLGAGAATGVFTTGKSIESLRKDVAHMQLEESRRGRVLELLAQWKKIAEPAQQGFEKYGQVLLTLMTRQDATADDFRAVLERQREELKRAEEQLLPLRDALRDTLEEDEWDRLFR